MNPFSKAMIVETKVPVEAGIQIPKRIHEEILEVADRYKVDGLRIKKIIVEYTVDESY